MRRHILGVCALIGLALGLLPYFVSVAGYSPADVLPASCLRFGILLGAIWLGYPQAQSTLAKVPGWLIGSTLIAFIAVLIRPKLLWLVIPILGVVVALQALGVISKRLGGKR